MIPILALLNVCSIPTQDTGLGYSYSFPLLMQIIWIRSNDTTVVNQVCSHIRQGFPILHIDNHVTLIFSTLDQCPVLSGLTSKRLFKLQTLKICLCFALFPLTYLEHSSTVLVVG
jgi:hypothetical protein